MKEKSQSSRAAMPSWRQTWIFFVFMFVGWTSTPANACVIGEVTTSIKEVGAYYEVGLRINFNWLGLVAVNTSLATLKVPKNGVPQTANVAVAGGSFTTSAYMKSGTITIQINAKTLAGQSKAKTIQLPAENTFGAKIEWH